MQTPIEQLPKKAIVGLNSLFEYESRLLRATESSLVGDRLQSIWSQQSPEFLDKLFEILIEEKLEIDRKDLSEYFRYILPSGGTMLTRFHDPEDPTTKGYKSLIRAIRYFDNQGYTLSDLIPLTGSKENACFKLLNDFFTYTQSPDLPQKQPVGTWLATIWVNEHDRKQFLRAVLGVEGDIDEFFKELETASIKRIGFAISIQVSKELVFFQKIINAIEQINPQFTGRLKQISSASAMPMSSKTNLLSHCAVAPTNLKANLFPQSVDLSFFAEKKIVSRSEVVAVKGQADVSMEKLQIQLANKKRKVGESPIITRGWLEDHIIGLLNNTNENQEEAVLADLYDYLCGTYGQYDQVTFELAAARPLPVFEFLGSDFFSRIREKKHSDTLLVKLYHYYIDADKYEDGREELFEVYRYCQVVRGMFVDTPPKDVMEEAKYMYADYSRHTIWTDLDDLEFAHPDAPALEDEDTYLAVASAHQSNRT